MSEGQRIRVWDVGVRLFHWSLVVLFVVAYLTGEEETAVHAYTGYAVAGLVIFRIIWGFAGPRHARFTDFVVGPVATFRYLGTLFRGRPEQYSGHNPAGGWMVLALLAALLAVSWSGLAAYGAEGRGPLAGHFAAADTIAVAGNAEAEPGEAAEEYWEEIHEIAVNVTLLLIFLHIAGVAVASFLHRENLIRAMITGYKDVAEEERR